MYFKFHFFVTKCIFEIFYKNGLLKMQLLSFRKTHHIRMGNLTGQMIGFQWFLISFSAKCHVFEIFYKTDCWTLKSNTLLNFQVSSFRSPSHIRTSNLIGNMIWFWHIFNFSFFSKMFLRLVLQWTYHKFQYFGAIQHVFISLQQCLVELASFFLMSGCIILVVQQWHSDAF